MTRSLAEAVDHANGSGRRPVLFLHGLWVKPEGWAAWARLFEGAGYAALTPGWPTDGGAIPSASVGAVVEHHAAVIRALGRRPVLIGHSFGGLIAQMLAGQGLAEATVAVSPAPFRGVLPLPLSAVRSAWPVLRRPGNARGQVALTPEQFRYAFGNAVSQAESRALYDAFHQPAPGRPVFQAALANLNPWTEAKVATTATERGPLLLIGGDKDHTVPMAVVRAAYGLQRRNRSAVTELLELPGRGHSLTLDSGWEAPAPAALEFVRRFAAP